MLSDAFTSISEKKITLDVTKPGIYQKRVCFALLG